MSASNISTSAIRIFGAPLRYLQGPGALEQIGQEAKLLGTRPLLVADEFVRKLIESDLKTSFQAEGMQLHSLAFNGEVTANEVARLSGLAAPLSVDVVIAAGGGKGIDIGKAVARSLSCPVITVPTAASNDAPTSKIFVLYDENHRLASVEHLAHNPSSVIVDTLLISKAPLSLLRAGIGDALSKKFEVERCAAAGGKNIYGGLGTHAASSLADFTYRQLRTHAEPALAAVESGRHDEHDEALVEATVLLSGLCFENGGLSISHALTRGLSAIPGTSVALHGLQVAYGLLVQWVLESRPQNEFDELLGFYEKVGLPRNLRELGLREVATRELLLTAAELTMSAPHTRNFPYALTSHDIASAMAKVEGMSLFSD